MSLKAGTTVRLRVAKEVSPFGYFLADEDGEEVLLPYAETGGARFEAGDEQEVFLFHDTKNRITATMKQALIHLDELALLEVADVHPRLGCFLEMGIGRQLLLPNGELPEFEAARPQVGDRVYVRLAHDKQGRIIGRAAREQDFRELVFAAPDSWMNEQVDCRVYSAQKAATFVVCDGGALGFGALGMIHESERLRPLRVGEQVTARVTHVRRDGRVNLSMRPRKEIGMEQHAADIYDFLQARPNGAMPYADDTPAEVIADKFGISKAAFKRALGRLMKMGKIRQEAGWTHLIEQDDSEKG